MSMVGEDPKHEQTPRPASRSDVEISVTSLLLTLDNAVAGRITLDRFQLATIRECIAVLLASRSELQQPSAEAIRLADIYINNAKVSRLIAAGVWDDVLVLSKELKRLCERSDDGK